MKTKQEIAEEARELRDRINWFGGEREVTTAELRDALSDLAGLVYSLASIDDPPRSGKKIKK